MRKLMLMMVVATLVFTTACKTKGLKPAPKPVAEAKAPEHATGSEHDETAAEKEVHKVKEKKAQQEKRIKLPLGMVPIPVLVKQVGMSPEQIKEVRKAYKSFHPRIKEAVASIEAATDKAAARKATTPLRKEIFTALRAICTKEQKAKFNAYLQARWAAQKEKNPQ